MPYRFTTPSVALDFEGKHKSKTLNVSIRVRSHERQKIARGASEDDMWEITGGFYPPATITINDKKPAAHTKCGYI